MINFSRKRPFVCVILAMSADGKIADKDRSAARFGSSADKAHLERQVARADGVLFGAGTLRAYGTTLRVVQPELLQQRQQQDKPLQPAQIVCSRSANFDPNLPFFRQSVPRWLLTTRTGAQKWNTARGFERILIAETIKGEIDWSAAFQQFIALGFKQLAVLGGAELVASLLAEDLIDEFWLTFCPLILGGRSTPGLVEGIGFSEKSAPRLQLLEMQSQGDEVFLHYRVVRASMEDQA
jgi:5-amino-6-(5-phosphoribosylamino)uracil reductase